MCVCGASISSFQQGQIENDYEENLDDNKFEFFHRQISDEHVFDSIQSSTINVWWLLHQNRMLFLYGLIQLKDKQVHSWYDACDEILLLLSYIQKKKQQLTVSNAITTNKY